MFKQLLILTTLLTLIAGISYAAIINIPDEVETIQGGIDTAERGDTVLVQPGRYEENIVLVSDILVASLYLSTNDEEFIVSTIIDGGGNDVVVVVNERENSILNGFTITGGNNNDGGGIYCEQSEVSFINLIVEDNTARSGGGIYFRTSESSVENVVVGNNEATGGYGGGIYILESDVLITNCIVENNSSSRSAGGIFIQNSTPILTDVFVRGNTAETIGGGMRILRSDPTLIRVSVTDNTAEQRGGGIESNNNSSPIMTNITVAGNESGRDGGGGIFCGATEITMTNCIVWHNDPPEIVNAQAIEATFSDFEERIIGEGNIDDDPLFVDLDNSDYNLTRESPCYNTGDPDSELDPDGSRADMGAFSVFNVSGLNGYVFDLQNEQPLGGATVITEFGFSATSNDEGYWQIMHPYREEPFSLIITMLEYLDSTLVDLEFIEDDTLSVDVNLLHAELEPSVEGIVSEIEIGEEAQIEFSISNPGNGTLSWYSDMRYRGDAGCDPWELRQSFAFGEQLDDARLYGVVFIDSLYYISGANEGSPAIYIINIEGELINTFAQPGEHNRGMKDLTYDGELIWGVLQNTVYGITLDGEIADSFDAPYNPSTAITWDPDHDIFWICSTVSNPVGVDREGNQVDGMEIRRDGMRIYSLTYFIDDVDNAPLYIFSKEDETNRQTLHKYNFDNDEKIFITYLEPEAGGNPFGSFITNKLDNYSWVFMSVADNVEGDRVDIWQLKSNMSWFEMNPIEGTVIPAAEQVITLSLNTAELAMIDYPAELTFIHNGFGLETTIPFDLTVTPLSIDNRQESLLPLQFAITDIFPNPFNSIVRIKYAVPELKQVSIKVYDISGSLVDEIVDGLTNSGRHSATWDAGRMPSGIYFARMEAGGYSQTVKLMLMK